MRKFRFRSYLDDGLFVLLIMAAAAASAALEAGALLGALPSSGVAVVAKTDRSGAADRPMASASSVDGAVVSAVLAGAVR